MRGNVFGSIPERTNTQPADEVDRVGITAFREITSLQPARQLIPYRSTAEDVRVKPMPITMSGRATFNTFSYLLNGAHSLAQTAKDHEAGSSYCRISAVAFAAFAIEAHLNHLGEAKLPFWSIVEPKLPWRTKLDLIVSQFGVIPDFGKRPFQTLSDLFKFRDRLAHGKTTTEEKSYEYRNPGDDRGSLDPDWLKKFWSDETVERVLEDTFQIIELLHTKAGFEPHSLHLIGSGEFGEVSDEKAEPGAANDQGL